MKLIRNISQQIIVEQFKLVFCLIAAHKNIKHVPIESLHQFLKPYAHLSKKANQVSVFLTRFLKLSIVLFQFQKPVLSGLACFQTFSNPRILCKPGPAEYGPMLFQHFRCIPVIAIYYRTSCTTHFCSGCKNFAPVSATHGASCSYIRWEVEGPKGREEEKYDWI